MVLRQCCELCFAPNTVSKFVRVFPRAALFFLALHIVILIITVISYANKKDIKPSNTLVQPAVEDDLGYVKLPDHLRDNQDRKDDREKARIGRVKRVDTGKLTDD
ncbi:uncharacterized protein LOC111117909 [Crassostrea virginica]